MHQHDPGRLHHRRGRAAAGAQRAARGLAGPRHHPVADRTARGPADGSPRSGHRRAARRRPGDRRDLAGPPRRRLDQRAQHRPDARPDALAAAVRLHPDEGCRSTPRSPAAFGSCVVLLVLVVVLFGAGPDPRWPSAGSHLAAASNAVSPAGPSPVVPKESPSDEADPSDPPASLAILAACLAGLVAGPAPPAQAASYVPISGAGSTWSQVAVDAWRADVRASGVVVNYAGTGSTDGRSQYIQGTVDFAEHRDPVPEPARARAAGRDPEPPLRLPADRGRWYVVHVQPHRRRPARHRPAAVGHHPGQDLHRPDHAVERPGDHQRLRQEASRHPDHPGGALRRCRRLGPVHPLHAEPGAVDLLPVHPQQAPPERQRLPERVVLPGVRQLARRRTAPTASPTTSRRPTARARSGTSSTPTPSGSTSRSSACSTRAATSPSRPPATSRSL